MGLKMRERKSVVHEVAPRYRQAGKKEKGKILDEFVETTGYNCKYAIHVLSNEGKWYLRKMDSNSRWVRLETTHRGGSRSHVGRKKTYDEPVQGCILKIWRYFDHMCSKLLKAFITSNIDDLYRSKWRKRKGSCTTRGGSMLRNQIPMRVYFNWDERAPGFFEMDTVSHDGGFPARACCHTLSITDISTGWMELRAVKNNAHRWIITQLDDMRISIPYPILGLDSDNGSEFMNRLVLHWTEEQGITFTRGRSYRKNDNCFIEERNYHSVRKVIGYLRYEGDEMLGALQDVYRHLCPLRNYFYPCVRLVSKQRVDGKNHKVYDAPETPYARLLKDPRLSENQKDVARQHREAYDMRELKKGSDHAIKTLLALSRDDSW